MTFLFIAMAYVLPRCWWYYSDSVAYSAIIQHGTWKEWLHPHHLLLSPLLLGCWSFTTALGFQFHPLDVWRWIGVGSVVATLWLMIRAFGASGFSDRWTILAILSVASCWYLWLFSTTPTHYALVLPWLVTIYLELQRWNTPDSACRPSIVMVLALTVAVMLHQLAILVVIPILGWKWFLDHRDHQPFAPLPILGKLIWPSVLLYVAGGFIATGAADPQAIIQWATSYGQVPRYWWWGTIPPGVEPVDHWLNILFDSHRDLIWSMPYQDPRGLHYFMDRIGASAPVAGLWWSYINDGLANITNLLLVCLGLWSILAIAGFCRRGGALRDQLILALLWCAPFVLFHAFYSVQDGWFRLYYLLPMLWILTAPIVFATDRTWREIGTVLWGLLLAFTLTNNIANGYTIWRHPEANRWRTDLPQIESLKGWLVFGEPGFYYNNSAYPWAFTDHIVYQGELVKWKDVPTDAVEAPDTVPDNFGIEHSVKPTDVPQDFYIDASLMKDVPRFTRRDYVLHLGWTMPDQEGPKELWIPLEALLPDAQTQTGIYDLDHYTYCSWNPKLRKAVMRAPRSIR